MSIIATAVRHLIAAGVGGEDLIRAIEDMEDQIIPNTGEKSSGAERQARYRARKAQENVTCNGSDVTLRNGVTQEEKEKRLTKKEKEEPHSPKEKTPKGVKKKGGFPQPADVAEQTWQDFAELRSRKKSPLTETALAAIRREAEGIGWTLEQALRECCSRGWQGFKGEWVRQGGNHGKTSRKQEIADDLQRTLDAIRIGGFSHDTGGYHQRPEIIRPEAIGAGYVDILPDEVGG